MTAGDEQFELVPEELVLEAPRRPALMTVVPVALLPFILIGCCPCSATFVASGAPALGDALGGVPPGVVMTAYYGTTLLLVAVLVVLIHTGELRWRDARVHGEGVRVGFVRYRWRDLAGFSCREESVRLVVRWRPWTRWLGPVLWCEGKTLGEVVQRLEEHGVPRVDG